MEGWSSLRELHLVLIASGGGLRTMVAEKWGDMIAMEEVRGATAAATKRSRGDGDGERKDAHQTLPGTGATR